MALGSQFLRSFLGVVVGAMGIMQINRARIAQDGLFTGAQRGTHVGFLK